ncbi:hypothetical protein BJV78DRAFT_1153290 [Lactifluus subvellereus]|nr:hypothetical protein BJV78DRAFT_1153290 [Lactifluus subvellereus]
MCSPTDPIIDPVHDHTHFSASSTFPDASAPDSDMTTNPTSPSVCPGADDGLPIVRANSHESLHPSANQPSRSSNLACPQSEDGPFLSGATGRAGPPLLQLDTFTTASESHVSGGPHSGTWLRNSHIKQSPEGQAPHFVVPRPPDVPVRRFNSYDVPRYAKCSTVIRKKMRYTIEAFTTTFPYQDSSNQKFGSWSPATHPEGALYFFDKERRLFTDTDMRDTTLMGEIEVFYLHLKASFQARQLTIPQDDYDLVLDITRTEDGKFQWSYYCACHTERCLFWLEKHNASDMISDVPGVQSPAHIKHQLEALYWYHWFLFPVNFDSHNLSPAIYDELLGMLTFGCIGIADVMTSKNSASWRDDEQMQKMIKLVQGAKLARAGEEYFTAGATRLLSLFATWRFSDFHGQDNARLDVQKTLYVSVRHERTPLITVISSLLFLSPNVYLDELEEAWTDQHVLERVWQSLMTKMLGEWGDLILWSTVMLSVNVGFLAIPEKKTLKEQCAARVTLRPQSKYLKQNDHKHLGLEPMAIVFSLPWALLMWAMLFFAAALLLLCFRHANLQIRIPAAVVAAIVICPVTWSGGEEDDIGGELEEDDVSPEM